MTTVAVTVALCGLSQSEVVHIDVGQRGHGRRGRTVVPDNRHRGRRPDTAAGRAAGHDVG